MSGSKSLQVDVEMYEEYKNDIVKMLRPFVRCRFFSVVDKLASAMSKIVADQALFEVLRISRAQVEAKGELCETEDGVKIMAYVAKEESVKWLEELLKHDIVKGLDVCREIASRALAFGPTLKGAEEQSER